MKRGIAQPLQAEGVPSLLMVRICECIPLRCPKCGEPMRIIAFVLDRPTIERILDHLGQPTQASAVLSHDWEWDGLTGEWGLWDNQAVPAVREWGKWRLI